MPIFAHMTDSISMIATIPTLGVFSPMATNLLIGGFLVVSIVMILLVLIQRPQGGGLSGAFGAGGSGGGGAGQTAFGTKTGDVLTWATIGIFVCFLGFAIVLNFATRPQRAPRAETVITAPAGAAAPAELPTESPIDSLGEAIDDTTDAAEEVLDDAGEEDLPTDLPTGDE